MLDELRNHETRVYSQHGEDGALLHLFSVIGTTNRHFVEFGAKDGLELSNTANLRLHHGWRGLLLDAAAAPGDPLVTRAFVTAENVNELFARHGVSERFDLLSIDIDGNDYWVWKALDRFTPRVVVIEYNIFLPLDVSCTIPYDPDHRWEEQSHYHGASLAALRKLGEAKGYALVHTDSWAPNAFFVLRSELPADHVDLPLHELTDWGRFPEPPGTGDRAWVQV